jgi:hypothetical protein
MCSKQRKDGRKDGREGGKKKGKQIGKEGGGGGGGYQLCLESIDFLFVGLRENRRRGGRVREGGSRRKKK